MRPLYIICEQQARTSAYKVPLAAAIGPFVSLLYMCHK